MSAAPETKPTEAPAPTAGSKTKITDPDATQVVSQPEAALATVAVAAAAAAAPEAAAPAPVAAAPAGPAVTFLGNAPATLQGTGTSQTLTSTESKIGGRRRGPLFAALFGAAVLAGVLYFVVSAASDGAGDDEQPAETIKDEAVADAATFAPSTPDKKEAEAPPMAPTDPDDPATPKAVKAPAPTPSMLLKTEKTETATVKLASPTSTIAAAASAEPTMYFSTNKAQLSKETKQALDLWAVRLKHNKRMTLTLEGHCDERGTVKYNQKLGTARAKAAKAYLVAKGIEPRRLYTASYGKTRPAAKGHGESAWSQNRRVELKSAGKALVRR